jgi:putative signal transducing protein
MEGAMAEDDLVVVRMFGDRFAADVAKSALDAAGIESFVRGDDARAVDPGLWPGRGVGLIVRAEDAARAQEILTTEPKPE